MARARRRGRRPASRRCRRRRRGSARRSATISARSRSRDNLKPWAIVERRLKAAAEGDFVIALYNPASKARPSRIVEAFDLLRGLKGAATPVAFARAVGRADERLTLTTLGAADVSLVDMATLVIVGSSETRLVAREGARPWMLTPRSYGARAMSRDPGHHGVEIMQRLGLGRLRPPHHDDADAERARRLDLGIGRCARRCSW